MKVFVLDNLQKQLNDRHQVSYEVREQIAREFEEIDKLNDNPIKIMQHLKNNDAKKMKGAEHIYKYQLNNGDRILYTYGKFIPNVEEENVDSLFLVAYAHHEEQGAVARAINLNVQHDFAEVEDYLYYTDDSDFGDMDFNPVVECFSGLFSRNYCISDSEIVGDEGETEEEAYSLSEEKKDICNRFFKEQNPMLVFGGAGTGKTLVGIRLLHEYITLYRDARIAFFTQADQLREKVRSIFGETWARKNGDEALPSNVEIREISDYCMSYLPGYSRNNFVELEQFKTFLSSDKRVSKKVETLSVDFMEVWKEIRGIIKGSTGLHWERNQTYINKLDYPELELLWKDNVYFETYKSDKRRVKPTDAFFEKKTSDIASEYIKSKRQLPGAKAALDEIKKNYLTFDYDLRHIDKDEYLNLNDETSFFSTMQKETIWDIYTSYEDYLKHQKLFDDNDLARECIRKLDAGEIPQYDFIVCDEVQDLTELQILMLYKTAKIKNNIVFSGDSNQLVNPTSFTDRKLKELFRPGTMVVHYLRDNYRCPPEVVAIGNAIVDARQVEIGERKQLLEYKDSSKKRAVAPAMRLGNGIENLVLLLKCSKKTPGVAVIVPDNDTRLEIVNVLDKNGIHGKDYLSLISTVQEAKGMEYRYVILFGMCDLFNTRNKRHNSDEKSNKNKKRFYYNMLYVAVTRSSGYLCFMDETIDNPVCRDWALIEIPTYNIEQLHLDKLAGTREEWLKQAQAYYDAGQYDRALEIYEEFSANINTIWRCKMRLFDQKRDYSKAAHYCLLLDDDEMAKRIGPAINGDDTDAKIGKIYYQLVVGRYKGDSRDIVKIMKKCFSAKDELAVAVSVIMRHMKNAFEESVLKNIELSERIKKNGRK